MPPRRDVRLVIAGEEAEALAGDIYAKSLPGNKPEGRRVTLRFTSMPPLIKAYFRDLATAAPRGNNFLTLPLGSTINTIDDDASS